MNEPPISTFIEQATNFMWRSEFHIYVVTGVVLLFYQLPAYRRFRTPALLLIVISSGLALFLTIFDQMIGTHGPPDPNDLFVYFLGREIVWVLSAIIGTIGSLMFLRDYTRLAAVALTNPSSATPDEQSRDS